MKSNPSDDFIKVLDYLRAHHGILNAFAAEKAWVPPLKVSNIRRGGSSIDAVHVSALLSEFAYQLGPVIEELGLEEYQTDENNIKEAMSIKNQLNELAEQMKGIEELKEYLKENKLLHTEMKQLIKKLEKDS